MMLKHAPKLKVILLALIFSGYAIFMPVWAPQASAKEPRPVMQEDEERPRVPELFQMLIFTVGLLILTPPLLVLAPVIGLIPVIENPHGKDQPKANFAGKG